MRNTHDQQYDLRILDNSTRYGNTGQVRRARRQLNRKWAERNPPRHRNWMWSYCEYVERYGYLTGECRT